MENKKKRIAVFGSNLTSRYKRGLCRAFNIAAEALNIDLVVFNTYGRIGTRNGLADDYETEILDYMDLDLFDGIVFDGDGYNVDGMFETIKRKLLTVKCPVISISNHIDGFYNIAAETGLTPVLKKKIEETKGNLETLYSESEDLEYNKPIMLTSEQVEAWLDSFIDGDVEDDVFRKKIIETLVNSIVLYQDKLVIAYNMAEGKGLKSSEVRLMVDNSADYPKFIKNVLVVVVEL